jgi:EmrB/QacA subfamily drug resistance transporter
VSTVTSSSPARATEAPLRGLALFSVVAALMLTMLLQALFQTVLSTALPKIIVSFSGFDRYTWVITAYLLAMAATIPIAGKLSDQFGRKRFLVAGVVIFMTGSVLGGVAQKIDQLIAFRTLQGIGAGFGMTLVMTVLGEILAPRERARYQGLFGSIFAVSGIVGPLIGGWLTDYGPLVPGLVDDDTRWRWVFFVSVPMGAAALAALAVYLPPSLNRGQPAEGDHSPLRRIDWAGATVLTVGTVAFLLALTLVGQATYGWTSPTVITCLVLSAACLVAFFLVETRVREPIIALELFRNRVFSADIALAVGLGVAMMSVNVYMPIFLQHVLGHSATSAGAAITPMTASLVAGSTLCGLVVSRLGRYRVVAALGAVLIVAGALLLVRMTTATTTIEAIRNMIVIGLGVGTFFPLTMLIAQNVVPRDRLGAGTAAVGYFRSIGQVLGVTVIGLIVNHDLALDLGHAVPKNLAGLPPEPLGRAIVHGFVTLIVLGGLMLVVIAAVLRDVPLRSHPNR